MPAAHLPLNHSRKHLARAALATFVLTFSLSRVLVLLIMSRRIPDLYLHLGGTHVHHLNYGIFLLSGVGAYLLLHRPTGRALSVAAIVYGVGLALTFDEFGMWLHLGGSYWQRASFDGVTVVAALLGLVAFAPPIQTLRPAHWSAIAVAIVLTVAFGAMLKGSLRFAEDEAGPRLRQLELAQPR